MDKETITLISPQEENTRDYFVAQRSDGKRNYRFDYGKSRTCTHPRLTEIVIGASYYRCEECNFAFTIESGTAMPLHHVPKMALQLMAAFSKEFGMASLQEVIRWPTGTADGTPNKPAVPEGMSVLDLLGLLETVDTTTEDGGKTQLREIQGRVMVNGRDALTEAEVVAINATVEDFRENMLEGEDANRNEFRLAEPTVSGGDAPERDSSTDGGVHPDRGFPEFPALLTEGQDFDFPSEHLAGWDLGDGPKPNKRERFLLGAFDAAEAAFRDRPKRPSPLSLMRKIQSLRLPHWGKGRP